MRILIFVSLVLFTILFWSLTVIQIRQDNLVYAAADVLIGAITFVAALLEAVK